MNTDEIDSLCKDATVSNLTFYILYGFALGKIAFDWFYDIYQKKQLNSAKISAGTDDSPNQ